MRRAKRLFDVFSACIRSAIPGKSSSSLFGVWLIRSSFGVPRPSVNAPSSFQFDCPPEARRHGPGFPRDSLPARHIARKPRRSAPAHRHRHARVRPRAAQRALGAFAPTLRRRLGVRTLDALAAVIAFFEERRGRLYGFRFRDRADALSCAPSQTPGPVDQRIGTGDGATLAFQLVKTYGAAHAPYERIIAKPVAGSVRVAVGGVEQSPTAFGCDPATGLVTFAPGHVPATGAAITAGFAFDVPVRFELDELDIDLSAFEAGAIPQIPLVEIVV